MARKKQSLLEDLIDISRTPALESGSRSRAYCLPRFSLRSHFARGAGRHHRSKNYSQSIGGSVGRQLLITFSSIFQYVVPLAFLIGSVISFIRGRRQHELHRTVASNPTRDSLEKSVGVTLKTWPSRLSGNRAIGLSSVVVTALMVG